ncbi:MAG: flagellar hook-length control protein FliK, partial [Alphaproteobacteria bacterium]
FVGPSAPAVLRRTGVVVEDDVLESAPDFVGPSAPAVLRRTGVVVEDDVLESAPDFVGPSAPAVLRRTGVVVEDDVLESAPDFVGPSAPAVLRRTGVVVEDDVLESAPDFVGPSAPAVLRRTGVVVEGNVPKFDPEFVRSLNIGASKDPSDRQSKPSMTGDIPKLKIRSETNLASVQKLNNETSSLELPKPIVLAARSSQAEQEWSEVPGPKLESVQSSGSKYSISKTHSDVLERDFYGSPNDAKLKQNAFKGRNDDINGPDKIKYLGMGNRSLSPALNGQNIKTSNNMAKDASNTGSTPVNLSPPIATASHGLEAIKLETISTADQSWGQKLVGQLQQSISRGRTNNINLRLHPATLGALNIQIKKVGHKLEIAITTQTKTALKLLNDSQAKLAMLLIESGVKLEAVKILDPLNSAMFNDSTGSDGKGENYSRHTSRSTVENSDIEDQEEIYSQISLNNEKNKIVIYV